MALKLDQQESLSSKFCNFSISSTNPLDGLNEFYRELLKENSPLFKEYKKDVKNKVNSLLPFLLHTRNTNEETTEIIDLTIKILALLTHPIDELFPDLLGVKEIFTDNFLTKAIVDHIKFIVENYPNEKNESIEHSINLLNNILYVPDVYTNRYYINVKHQIMWNLFTEGIDKIIIYLTSRKYFAKHVVQFLAILYKNQHVGTLQKLLNTWLESSLSETSDGSQTIQQERFSILNISEISDENKNNDKESTKTFKEMKDKSPLRKEKETLNLQSDTDFGYVTQLEPENQNEELFCFNKTFVKSYYGSTLKYNFSKKLHIRKQRRHFRPRNLNDVLKEFTVDFLLKGYNVIVRDLHLEYFQNNFDCTHLFWLISYFFKFAPLIDLDLEYINSVLSADILSFLVFHGINIIEEIKADNSNPKKYLFNKLHFIILSVKEFLQVLQFYKDNVTLNVAGRCYIEKLEKELIEMKDLGTLFWHLIQNYNPRLQSKLYLEDLIVTNNNYLIFLDRRSSLYKSFNMFGYLKRFATHEIMRHYGFLLENFRENGKYVNDCIFTIMHHVAGDLNKVSVLIQKRILHTFGEILESDFELCNDWMDLMKYVINESFIKYRGELENKEKERMTFKNQQQVLESINEEKVLEDFDSLKNYVINEYFEHVLWIQEVLLKIYYIKFLLSNPDKLKTNATVAEAIIYNNLVANHPVHLVPSNLAQQSILNNGIFVAFLQHLGFKSNEGYFFNVPTSWSPAELLNVAEQLGPIHKHLKFEMSICTRTAAATGKMHLSAEHVASQEYSLFNKLLMGHMGTTKLTESVEAISKDIEKLYVCK